LKEVYFKLDLGDFPNEEVNTFVQENQYSVNQYPVSPELEEKLFADWDFSFKAWLKH
jgi:hypothetical protein